MDRRRAISVLLTAAAVAGASIVPAAGAKIPSYHSPGYVGTRKLPRVVPVTPAKPLVVSANGHAPHVLVDAAGTAHLAWSSDGNGRPGVLHYCRIPRGGRGCAATFAQPILQPAGGGNGPQTDIDYNGPFPLSIGNELLLLDSRCCNTARTPDGQGSGHPLYLFTSEDGGATFRGPTDPNSADGVIGTVDPSGNTVVYGGNDPAIGVITDTQTGGTIFQGVPAGQFTRASANLSVRADKQDATAGRLAVDGTRPVAAFDDLDGTTYVREWNGQGSVNDPANWSLLKLKGAYGPRIAAGASGTLLLTRTKLSGGRLEVRRIARGGGSAGRPIDLGPADGVSNEIAEDPRGAVAVARVDRAGAVPTVDVRTSLDGRHWTSLGAVARVPGGELGQLAVGVTADGGGFVSYRNARNAPNAYAGRIGAAQFGPIARTGRRGLGLVPGKGGPPAGDKDAYVACTKVHFGAIDAISKEGCFLRDASNPESGAAVTSGEFRLNGLDIVPDPGVKVAIDPREKKINSTGRVRVLLNAPGLDPITLWHGEIHVDLSTGGTGETLFDFDTSQSSGLEGFPFDGRIQVKLEPDAVDIPVHLQLPPYFGGVTGDADLKANNTDGVVFDSLHIGIDDANIGVLELKHVHVDYTRQGQVWDGGGELLLPGPISPDITADVRFEHGAFKHGSLSLSIKPGIPVFADVYLHEFALGFGLDPTVIEGSIEAGLYDGIGDYPINIVGYAKLQIGNATNPTVFVVGGTGQVLGLDVAHASFTYDSDGYVLFHIDAGVDAGPLGAKVIGDIFVLHGDFGANLSIEGHIFGFKAGLDAAASKKGLSICAGDRPGVDLPGWDPTDIKVHLWSCHMSDYQLQAPPAGGARAHAAAAGERTFVVARGQRDVDIELQGAGGAPSVVLVDPAGGVHAPAAVGTRGAEFLGYRDTRGGRTFAGLRNPQAGTWTVRAVPGSASIAALATSHVMPLPAIRARVSGRGDRRTLRFHLSHVVAGTKVQFGERAREGTHALGRPTSRSGTLRFRPGAGAGGRRGIVAVVTQDGYTRAQPVVAHFIAPRLRRPGRLGRLRLGRHGSRLTVSYGPAAGAFRYRIRVSATGGLSTQRTTTRRRVVITGVRRDARVRVTVRGVNVRGTAGPKRTARLRAPAQKHRRHRRRH